MEAAFQFNGLVSADEERPLAGSGAAPPAADPAELIAQIGAEVADALESALERVVALSNTGRIDRSGLQALRSEVERARRIGLMGPQIGRLASGRVQVTRDTVDLPSTLREVLSQRAREIASRGIELRQSMMPASAAVDPILLFTLLQALFDWSFEHASGRIDLMVDLKGWPERPHVTCSFDCHPGDMDRAVTHGAVAARLETMPWQLMACCARTLGLRFERHDAPGRTMLDIGFDAARDGSRALDTLLDLAFDARPVVGHNSKPLAGSHVLLVVARRDVRGLVRDALRPMGLMLDFVSSVEEARQFCLGGLPHAIVFEAPLGGARMQRLQAELVQEAPRLAFIEIAEEGHAFETTHTGGKVYARVSRNSLSEALPAALVFELSRVA